MTNLKSYLSERPEVMFERKLVPRWWRLSGRLGSADWQPQGVACVFHPSVSMKRLREDVIVCMNDNLSPARNQHLGPRF